MKPSRKLSRRSFVMQVSGGNPSGFGAPGAPGGQGKPGAASDHDLGHAGPGGGKGGDPDSGPEGSRKER